MPMGILSDSDFELELDKLNKVNNKGRVEILPPLGRGHNPAIPTVIKKIIGEEAIESGNKEAKNIARSLGISDSSVSAIKNGANSTASYHNPNPELKEHLDTTKDKIISVSKSRLLEAINAITPEKLQSAKVKDAAGVAKDMSSVIKNLEDRDKGDDDRKPFVIYAPTFVQENKFESIQVTE